MRITLTATPTNLATATGALNWTPISVTPVSAIPLPTLMPTITAPTPTPSITPTPTESPTPNPMSA